MKNIAADSSSLILAQKVGLLTVVLEQYAVTICDSVFRELTENSKKGSTEFVQLFAAGDIPSPNCRIRSSMGRGERNTIEIFLDGGIDFVLVDDKKAARYCRKENIPFINCLLLPRIFLQYHVLEESVCHDAEEKLIEAGYYSDQIIKKARSTPAERLQLFAP